MLVNTPCFMCKNYKNKYTCKAFENIPIEILLGKNKHKKPYKNDNGIIFEPIKKYKELN